MTYVRGQKERMKQMSTKTVKSRTKTTNKKQNYRVEHTKENGVVRIADDVIASIAGIAATEVEGVIRLTGNITNEIVSKIAMNNLSKGVRIEVENQKVKVALNCEILYGSNIPEIAQSIQDKVKQNVENMTGLEVQEVNVYVAAVTSER